MRASCDQIHICSKICIHISYFICACCDFVIHEVTIIPLFRKLIGSFVHFFTLQDEYAYWNSELKKSRKRKPTKHRKDKVEDQALAESTTAEEKKPIKKK